MKILWLAMAGAALVWAAGPAAAGYGDLKQDMDSYAPPAMFYQPEVPEPAAETEPDGFEIEAQALADTRRRWEKMLERKGGGAADVAVSLQMTEAASDDVQTLAMLRPRLSHQTAMALIVLRNPSIKGAQERLMAALEGFDQVTQLDEVLRQYAAFTESVMAGVGPMRSSDTIQMKFPFPGVTALKGQVAALNVEAERQTLELVRRDIMAQGSKAYWNLRYTHQALRITRDMLDRLNQLESVATTRYGAGKTSYQDVVKLRIGREKLAEQVRTLKEQRVNLETELLSLMDLGPNHSVGWPDTLTPESSLPQLGPLYSLALENRPELNRMRAMVAKMERMVELAETMIQPAFTQNYSLYTDEAALQVGGAATKPTFAATVSPTRGKGLPKNAWFGTQDAYLRETRKKRDALRADLADAEARTRLMVRNGWFDLDRALRERALYQDRLLELSQTSLDVSTRGYESGNVSFADVIASYTDWLDVSLASRRRNSDVGVFRAELERRVGTALP
jgi:outer membrane protein TolC